jgi:hypothetical protein
MAEEAMPAGVDQDEREMWRRRVIDLEAHCAALQTTIDRLVIFAAACGAGAALLADEGLVQAE